MLFSLNTFCKEEKEAEFAVFPQFAYSEETGFWGGLITYYRYPLKLTPDLKNQLDFQVVYTQKKQLQLRFFPILNFHEGNSKLDIETSFMKWPSEFYGVANTDVEKEINKYTSEMLELKTDFQHNIISNWFYHIYSNQFHNVITKRENIEAFAGIPGNEEYLISGFGGGLAYDSRDKENFPTKGIFVNFKMISFRGFWGSDYNFENFELDIREYFGLFENHVLAFQQYFSYNSDTVPFQKMYKLGEYVRAFNDALFINNHGITFKAEYRFFPFHGKIFERIGFAAFYDVGQGMQDLNELAFSNFRCSFGAGLRISIFVEDRFNLRFDYGRCSSNGSVNIGGGETF